MLTVARTTRKREGPTSNQVNQSITVTPIDYIYVIHLRNASTRSCPYLPSSKTHSSYSHKQNNRFCPYLPHTLATVISNRSCPYLPSSVLYMYKTHSSYSHKQVGLVPVSPAARHTLATVRSRWIPGVSLSFPCPLCHHLPPAKGLCLSCHQHSPCYC